METPSSRISFMMIIITPGHSEFESSIQFGFRFIINKHFACQSFTCLMAEYLSTGDGTRPGGHGLLSFELWAQPP